MYFLNYFLSFHLEIATSTIATHITDDIDGEGGSGLRKIVRSSIRNEKTYGFC